MMKIISIIKSFLFGDTEEECTQHPIVREDIEIEENSQYIPPIDTTTISDESEYILDTQSNCFDVSNVEEQKDQAQNDSLPLSYQLKSRATSTIESIQLQEADLVDPKVEKEAIGTSINPSARDNELLVKSFTELIKELDTVLNKSEDENSRQTIKFCQSRIIEILSNNGIKTMENNSIFDSTRHVPVPFRIVPNGTPITNVERIGLTYAGKVVLKAQVNV